MPENAEEGHEQPGFHYFCCPDCEFDSIQKADFNGSEDCPICLMDSGHNVTMVRRVARSGDRPEGRDARVVQ